MVSLLNYNSAQLRKCLEMCDKLNIKIVAYSPIGQGLLTDRLTLEAFLSGKIRAARITGVKWEELQKLRNTIQEIAQETQKSMAQVSVNWVISHGWIPLVGCTKPWHVEESIKSLGWQLTPTQLAALDEAALCYSTLEKPRLRRGFFIVLISFLVLLYRIERFFSWQNVIG